jgi:asparagine synthase (glutamine-hydrolysing)
VVQQKRILKAAMRGRLPDAIVDRPKRGFSAPISVWFRQELRDMAHDVLLSPRALQRGYFQSAAITRLLQEHCTRRQDRSEELWDLLVLELWHRTFVDGAGRQC